VHDCLARERCLAADEDGLVSRAGEEEQGVVLVGQVDEVQNEARLLRERAGLPDLHPAEGADHDEARRGNTGLVVGRLDPVAQRLLAMLGQPFRLARCLHLDQADARPDQVEEAPGLGLLETRGVGPTRAVAVEELVEERLRLRTLAAFVDAPVGGERGEPRADLLAGRRHGYESASWSLGTWK
jgi:hypothetical protein